MIFFVLLVENNILIAAHIAFIFFFAKIKTERIFFFFPLTRSDIGLDRWHMSIYTPALIYVK